MGIVEAWRAAVPGSPAAETPLVGYEDQAAPAVFERKIDAAADHALTRFIFDWYWHDGSPFLQRCLEEGYMRARKQPPPAVRSYVGQPRLGGPLSSKLHFKPPVVFDGVIRRPAFDKMTDYIVSKYFSHASYWKVDGSPYFSIYELYRLVENLGGVEPAAAALQSFRAKTKAAGFPGLHLDAVTWGVQILSGEKRVQNPRELLAVDRYLNRGYPFTSILVGNTPAAFKKAIESAKRFLDSTSHRPRILTLNAWNEWTEGSCLEPDTVNGMKYLEAVRNVFR